MNAPLHPGVDGSVVIAEIMILRGAEEGAGCDCGNDAEIHAHHAINGAGIFGFGWREKLAFVLAGGADKEGVFWIEIIAAHDEVEFEKLLDHGIWRL